MYSRLCFLLSIVLISHTSFSQKLVTPGLLTNDSLKFEIVWKPRMSPYGKMGGKYVIINMSKKTEKFLLKKNYDYWSIKFEGKKTDLAADIALYYLYQREATKIYAIKGDMIRWENIKDDEIKYWKQFFKEKNCKFSR